MTIRKLEYVDAAKVMGLSSFRILLRHLLPNIVSPIIVVTTFNIASNVLTEASLSFLGLGVDVSMPSWGSMLADSKSYVISGEALVVLRHSRRRNDDHRAGDQPAGRLAARLFESPAENVLTFIRQEARS